MNLPKVIKTLAKNKKIENFPVDHFSYSSLVQFSSNPILFKIKNINKEIIDTTKGISGVIGQAVHNAIAVYYGGSDSLIISNESEAIEYGLKSGMEFLEAYNDGFIAYSTTVPNKQKAQEILAFTFNSYVAEMPYDDFESGDIISVEEKLQESIDVEWRGKKVVLPIPLKGYTDLITRNQIDKLLRITDHKTCRSFSNPEKIDGSKMIQAVVYYFLVYAKYGEAPYSMIYDEIKTTKNRDGSPQIRSYEVIYSENELFFDFFFRLYEDTIKAINGESVFVPNINALYDNEVSIISYIHRLDIEEETAKLLKKMKVENITDLLKKQIQNAGSMRKFLKTAEDKFVSAKNLNYDKMQTEEKIKTKLMEFGMLLDFVEKIEGSTVDLYKFNPSIGLKMSKLAGYTADMEQVIGISGIRVLAPIQNSNLVGFEVPKEKRTFPNLKDVDLKIKSFELSIGLDIMGDVYKFDLRKSPHTLIAGATGSGKSIFLNSVIKQLDGLDNTELHLFDPKLVELAQFRKLNNVVEYQSDIEDIHSSLESLVSVMESRYKKLQKSNVKSISEYKGNMPYKFVIIDEFGDLVIGNHVKEETISSGEIYQSGPRKGQEKTTAERTYVSKEINQFILKLAQKSRACGIHLIIATQRPSTNIITGDIKANFPTKVAFRTAKSIDSQILLDNNGAEKLLGMGDMILSSERGEIRLQGFNC